METVEAIMGTYKVGNISEKKNIWKRMTKAKGNKKTFGKVMIKVFSFGFRRNEIPCFYKEELKKRI